MTLLKALKADHEKAKALLANTLDAEDAPDRALLDTNPTPSNSGSAWWSTSATSAESICLRGPLQSALQRDRQNWLPDEVDGLVGKRCSSGRFIEIRAEKNAVKPITRI
jgi:hypothetical protein